MTKRSFSNVSVLTVGPARGHGLMIDSGTLQSVLAQVQGRTLKAYLSHANAGADRLGAEVGTFSNFRLERDRIRADFEFLESFVAHSPQVHQTLVELAERDAESFGVSIVGTLRRVWPTEDGEEIEATGEFEAMKPGNALNEFPSARFQNVRSADFVSQPAANVGLFAALEQRLARQNDEVAALTAERDSLRIELARLQNAAEEINLLQNKVRALASRLEQAERFDMRKAGAPSVALSFTSSGSLDDLPSAPLESASDQTKWAHYVALEARNPRMAEAYRKQHLSAARR